MSAISARRSSTSTRCLRANGHAAWLRKITRVARPRVCSRENRPPPSASGSSRDGASSSCPEPLVVFGTDAHLLSAGDCHSSIAWNAPGRLRRGPAQPWHTRGSVPRPAEMKAGGRDRSCRLPQPGHAAPCIVLPMPRDGEKARLMPRARHAALFPGVDDSCLYNAAHCNTFDSYPLHSWCQPGERSRVVGVAVRGYMPSVQRPPSQGESWRHQAQSGGSAGARRDECEGSDRCCRPFQPDVRRPVH